MTETISHEFNGKAAIKTVMLILTAFHMCGKLVMYVNNMQTYLRVQRDKFKKGFIFIVSLRVQDGIYSFSHFKSREAGL